MGLDFSGVPPELLENMRTRPAEERLVVCEIHDVLAYGRCYVVKAADMPRMPAMLGSLSASMMPWGTRDITMLVPGTRVLCWFPSNDMPVILAALSSPMGSPSFGWPDFLTSASHAGFASDAAHQLPVTKPSGHGLFDFSAGTPVDALPGDWGHVNELGMGVFLGRLLTWLRAGDLCKLEMHYVDMLARLVAYNWQMHTAGSSVEALNDEGEWSQVEGFTPFPWEALGARTKAVVAFRDGEGDLLASAPEMGVEPVDTAQAPFFRMLRIFGFLGDLERRYVVLPSTAADVRTYGRAAGSAPLYKGLLEETIGLDGGYSLRSARGISFEKTCWIPVPEERYPRDNPNGDTDFTDAAGIGITQSEYPAATTPSELQAHGDDERYHWLNKRTSVGVNQRDTDWQITDDDTLDAPGGFSTEEPPLAPYSGYEQALPDSAEETLVPDSSRKARYYQGRAFMGILPDGSILLRDAYGGELRLSGGNIEISCPGDIVMRSGRRVQVWGGKDLVLKAYEDIDASSARGSVRVKAEHNLMLLGGNDGTGGVLVENRGTGGPDFSEWGANARIGGLILKSSRGKLMLYGRDAVNVHATHGPMVLDAGSGQQAVYVYANQEKHYVRSGFDVLVAPRGIESDVRTLSLLSMSSSGITYYGSSVKFGTATMQVFNHRGTGSAASASINIKGSLSLVGSGRASGGFSDADVADTFSERKSEADERLDTVSTAHQTRAGTDYNNDTALGNSSVYGLIGVSFRASSDLGLGEMRLLEAGWQKRFRQAANISSSGTYTGSVWVEPEVPARVTPAGTNDTGRTTRPFPGHQAWENGSDAAFRRCDDGLRVNGRPLERGEKGVNYDNVVQPSVVDGAFKDTYPINP